jgi:nicotinamidase-related amidase
MAERKHTWEDVVDDEIRAISGPYKGNVRRGKRPVLLCIDLYNAVYGDRSEPILEAIKRFPSSCGPAAWEAVEPIRKLQQAARAAGIPVIHTTRDLASQVPDRLLTSTKRKETFGDPVWESEFFAPLAPEPGELVIHKVRASGFFGTPLASHLVEMGADAIIMCGESTSGCVRATCLEGKMYGYPVTVVEDCVFDRNWLSHKVNLYDMDLKYADVVFLEDALAYIESIAIANGKPIPVTA